MLQIYTNLAICPPFPSESTHADSSFTLFRSLPTELKEMIFNFSIVPRIINIEDLYSTSCQHLQISLLATCKLSRRCALKVYSPWGKFRFPFNKHPLCAQLPYYPPHMQAELARHEKPFFSVNYVDFENDIFVLDAPGILADRSGKSSCFGYNDNDSHLDRVRHVAMADTTDLWIQDLDDTSGNDLYSMEQLFRKETVGARTMFRFNKLRTLTFISKKSIASSRGQEFGFESVKEFDSFKLTRELAFLRIPIAITTRKPIGAWHPEVRYVRALGVSEGA